MVCVAMKTTAISQKSPKTSQKSMKKVSKKPYDKEMDALRHLVPGSTEKSDLDLVLNAIAYIQKLEKKLKNQSNPDLLKAQYLAIHRMKQQQVEA